MMTIRPGDFWVADTPFTEGSASKKRPVRTLSEVKGKERDFANPPPVIYHLQTTQPSYLLLM